jgi:hypothetical protein
MTFVKRLLDQSKLPLTVTEFWRYSFFYWGIFAVITLGQFTMLWFLQQGVAMRSHELFIWLLDGLFWWSTTPLVLYASVKIPIAFKVRQSTLLKPVLYHLLIVTFLNILINTFHWYITNPLMFLAIGKALPFESYLFSFFTAYTAALANTCC